jgi:hypothetical protein
MNAADYVPSHMDPKPPLRWLVRAGLDGRERILQWFDFATQHWVDVPTAHAPNTPRGSR